jgi:hypothetical protein
VASDRRREQLVVLSTEAPAVAGVGVERAERDTRLLDAEPFAQPLARDASRFDDDLAREKAWDVAQRNVRGGQHDPEGIGHPARGARRGEHHGDGAAGACGEQLGVSREVVAAGEERVLVERRRHDPIHRSAPR